MKILKLTLTVFLLTSVSLSLFAQAKKTSVQKSPVKLKVIKTAAPSLKKEENPGTSKVKITTDLGVIIVRLYDSTPKHRDNFLKLVTDHFYDSLIFHRVISSFMIQGGDPMSKNASPEEMLGMGGGDMSRIPAEFNNKLIHKKGVLAAARDGNPEKASSACQFYIVQGKPFTDDELNMIEMQKGFKYTPAQRNLYKTIGGTPFLDMEYTVFGEVVSGLDVVDKIAAVQKGPNDRPVKDVRMKMEVLKNK